MVIIKQQVESLLVKLLLTELQLVVNKQQVIERQEGQQMIEQQVEYNIKECKQDFTIRQGLNKLLVVKM